MELPLDAEMLIPHRKPMRLIDRWEIGQRIGPFPCELSLCD
jgi:hypothetical protein